MALVLTPVVLLSLAAFLSGAALRLCDGLLPRLAKDFAVSPGTAGQVVLVFSMAYGLMQLVFGPLGDRFGKARMVTWALAGCAVASAASALASSLEALRVMRWVWGMAAAGIIPLAMAWIGDAVAYEHRQATLAQLLLGTLSGMTAGQLAGGLFGDSALGWRGAFAAIAVGYACIAALMALRAAQAAPAAAGELGAPPRPMAGRTPRASWAQRYGRVLATPWNRRVLGAAAAEGLLLLGPLAFLPAYLHQRFGLSLSAASGLVALYAVGGLAYALLARRLVPALGERRMVRAGGMLMGLGFLGWWASPVGWTAAPVALAVGFGTYLFHNTLQALATQMAPEARGTAVSLFAFALFGGQALGVTLAGLAFDHAGPAVLLLVPAAALPLLGLGLSAALRSRVHTEA
jgi:predicted MFS family arabinose efflux permease